MMAAITSQTSASASQALPAWLPEHRWIVGLRRSTPQYNGDLNCLALAVTQSYEI